MSKSIIFSDTESQINSTDFDQVDMVVLSTSSQGNIDIYLTELIEAHLSNKEYDNILIPLSFGEILSDYLGLSLATHIKISNHKNKKSNLFIYGTEKLAALVEELYFNVILLKNVSLIDYNLKSIKKALSSNKTPITDIELTLELQKLNIQIPISFYDNHSVANIWGMHRLLEIEGINKNEISDLKGDELLTSVYFKWLLAKNKISDEVIKEAKEQTKEYRHKINQPKVLGKIDLNNL